MVTHPIAIVPCEWVTFISATVGADHGSWGLNQHLPKILCLQGDIIAHLWASRTSVIHLKTLLGNGQKDGCIGVGTHGRHTPIQSSINTNKTSIRFGTLIMEEQYTPKLSLNSLPSFFTEMSSLKRDRKCVKNEK